MKNDLELLESDIREYIKEKSKQHLKEAFDNLQLVSTLKNDTKMSCFGRFKDDRTCEICKRLDEEYYLECKYSKYDLDNKLMFCSLLDKKPSAVFAIN